MAAAPKQPVDEEKESVPCPGLDALFYGLTLAVFAASSVADLFVVIEHWLNTYKSWALFTVGLAFVPSCFLQLLSLKWYQASGKLKYKQWISHTFHLAIAHRFCFLLNHAIKTIKVPISSQQRDWFFTIEKDAFTLNLFTAMLVYIPQIIFQVYVMAVLQHISFWTSTSVITSLCSLTWALTSYSLLTNRAVQDEAQFTWSSVMIQGFWRGGMLTSRIAALVLAAIYLKTWIFVIFGIHTLGTTLSVIQQTTKSCLSTVDELVYKCLIGAVYFFDFLKLLENQVKYHVYLFYAIMIAENAVFYVLYLVYFKNHYHTNVFIVSSVMILGGSFIGAVSMIMHFCMFPNIKTIKLCKRIHFIPEAILKKSSAKSIGKTSPNKKWNNQPVTDEPTGRINPDSSADKKSLLTDIAQNAELMEKGIVNSSFCKSDEANVTVEVVVEESQVTNVEVTVQQFQNQAVLENEINDSICHIDVSVEKMDHVSLNKCNMDVDPQLCSQKRRGICSLTQLGLQLITDEDNYVEKSFSLDKLKSNSEVSINVEDKSIESMIIESLPIKSLANENCETMAPDGILARCRLHTPVISENGEKNLTNAVCNHHP
ncbi:XK-related protein 5-like [Copidosoma floridanum]|uniref:XK-related protein 5-like n=1 Tax=Copidosoma floridanum TaxID=29053 RepID=UPI0006C9570F|nr:XK-related protein 5-like [Copidosoma floridanum]